MMKRTNSRGFTIVELLIATVIFSLVLLIITAAIIQFSRVYYKGVITSRTQEVARIIVEDAAKSAQFSAGGVTSGTAGGYNARCLGDRRFNYILDQPLVGSQTHVLTVDNESSCGAYNSTSTLPSDAVELLGENMRLSNFVVTGVGDTVRIRATIAYGGNDDLDRTDPLNPVCRPVILGGQFCAVSTIETTVNKRL